MEIEEKRQEKSKRQEWLKREKAGQDAIEKDYAMGNPKEYLKLKKNWGIELRLALNKLFHTLHRRTDELYNRVAALEDLLEEKEKGDE